MNGEAKKYYKETKLFFPIHGKSEKQFFKDIKIRILELNEKNPQITYRQICDILGEPYELMNDYFDNVDMSYLTKRLKISNYFKSMIIGLWVVILVLVGIRIHYLDKAYEAVRNDIVFYEDELIE